MAILSFTKPASLIVVTATNDENRSFKLSEFKEIRKSVNSDGLIVEFIGNEYFISPAVDTVTLGATTYAPGSQTTDSLYTLFYASPVFQVNYALSGGAPGTPVLTPATTGGTLAAATYFYKITAIKGGVESLESLQASATTTGTTSSIAITWAAPSGGADSYRIYRGTTSNGQNTFFTSVSASFIDIGGAGTAGTPPVSNPELITVPIKDDKLFLQIDYTGLVATNVVAELWTSATELGTYSKKSGSDIALVAGGASVNKMFDGLSFQYAQVRLVVPTAATAGTITTVFAKQEL